MRFTIIIKKAKAMIFGCMLGCVGTLPAQVQSYCGTDAVHDKFLSDNPEAAAMQEVFEQVYRARVEELKVLRTTNTEPKGSEALKYTIPCVVHVIHNNGPENISDAQVISQFKRMNEDFRRMPETLGFGSGADYQAEFELASIDPNGNPTNGIVRVQSGLTVHNMDSQQGTLKNLSKWPQNKYLNIWIVRSIASTQPGVLAYATFPSNSSNSNDGIVNSYFCWGTMGSVDNSRNKGRVGTHEVGHWLALFHTFQSGCSGVGTMTCTAHGDRVCDTPPTSDAAFGNPARRNSCQEPNDRPDRTRNYMDYADDNFKDEFSEGQKLRSHTSLENDNFRRNMFEMSNLQATGTGPYRLPVANFISENRFPCVGTPIQFIDWSGGHPNSWNWTFTGGTPASSSDRNPIVTYAAPGIYEVSLSVGNLTGNSPTFTKTEYIVVTDQMFNFPYSEDFNSTTFPPAGWRVDNPDGGITYNASDVNAFGGTGKSVRMNMNIYRAYDQKDGLISPPLDLSNANAPMVYFAMAYAQHSDLYSDTLRIFASDDCGSTWNEIFMNGGADLSTIPALRTTGFIPVADEWQYAAAELFGYAGKNNVQIRFETQNGYGNGLYIDDVQVREPWAVSLVDDQTNIIQYSVQPNPFQNNFKLVIQNPGLDEHIRLNFTDLAGRTVLDSREFILNQGNNEISILTDGLQTGVYFIKIQFPDGNQQVLKLMKQ